MQIQVGENSFELYTKLGAGVEIERAFNRPVMEIFSKLKEATTEELIKIVAIAAKKKDDPEFKEFRTALLALWDYSDLYDAVQKVIARIMFSGTSEENEKKLARTPMSEAEKNELRKILEMPVPDTSSTGENS